MSVNKPPDSIATKKPDSSQSNNSDLARKLGLAATIALGVGSTVGSGIFSTLSQVAEVAGSSLFLVLAYLIGSLLQIPASLTFAELSSAYPEDGGMYVFFKRAGSKSLAFLCGWVCFLATDAPSVSIMSLAFVSYMNVLFPFLSDFALRIIAVGFIVAFMILHIKSVKGGGIFQSIITFLKILPFVVIIGIGVFCINPDLFLSSEVSQTIAAQPEYYGGAISLIAAASVTAFSFDGLFSACYMSGEIKNPRKNLPRGLIIAVLIVMVLYIGLTAIASGLMTIDEIAESSAPISLMASKLPTIGELAEPIVAVMAILVILGTISSSIMYQPRMQYVMARDGYFFNIFGKVHKKYNTPHMSIIINGTVIIVLTLFGNLEDVLAYFTLVVLLRNCAALCTIFIFRKKDTYNPSYQCPFGYVMPIIAVVINLILIVATFLSEPIGAIFSVGIIITGIPAFFIWNYKKKNKSLNTN